MQDPGLGGAPPQKKKKPIEVAFPCPSSTPWELCLFADKSNGLQNGVHG